TGHTSNARVSWRVRSAGSGRRRGLTLRVVCKPIGAGCYTLTRIGGSVMRPSRMRFTVRRLMAAVAIIAVILAGTIKLPGILKRRSELLGIARYYRWRESNLRRAAGVIRSCPEGPGRDGRGATSCRSCSGAWMGLKPEFAATHAEAARSLL